MSISVLIKPATDSRSMSGCSQTLTPRVTREVLGCHIVGEQAVEIAQVVSIVIAAGMKVDELARVPLSFPTYAGILGRLAASISRELNLAVGWQAN